MLANFAAGVFLVILRPFRVGDYISAGGVTGQVHEIGLFATTIDTDQNLRVFVGNNKIFGDNITNFSSNAYRRVDLVAQLAGSVDPQEAIRALRERIAKIPGVLQSPAPAIELVDFKLEGPVLAVRPFCKHPDYWPVYFATNVAIQETFSAAGYPAPSRQIHLVQKAG